MKLPRRGGAIILVSVLLALTVVGGASLYYGSMREDVRARAHETLAAVAEMKVRLVLDWKKDQLDHALAIARIMGSGLPGLQAAPDGKVAGESLLALFTHSSHGDGSDLMVLDESGVLLWSTHGERVVDAATVQAALEAAHKGTPVLSRTFSLPDAPELILVDAVAPIPAAGEGAATFVVIRKPVTAELTRLVGAWPLLSESAETVVAESAGGIVTVLSTPRDVRRVLSERRVPAERRLESVDEETPLGRGAARRFGSVRGVDYRGRMVLADIRQVNGSDWFLVSKLDEQEVMAASRTRVALGGGIVLLMLLTGTIAAGYLYRRREVELFRELYEAERLRLEEGEALRRAAASSEERLRLALEAADHGLFDLDIQTGECQVSSTHARMLGYEADSFRESLDSWRQRLHPEDRNRAVDAYERYIRGESAEYQVEFRLQTQDGGWKWILSRGRVVAWAADGSPLRMLGTHTDISEQRANEDAAQQRESIYREQRNALIELSTQSDASECDVGAWAARFTTVAARALGVRHASVWLLSDDGSEIRCVDSHDLDTGDHVHGAVLARADAPAYFAALESLQLVAAADAQHDPRTAELADAYLIPGGVASMLDVPIQVGGRVVGVLCHEHCGEIREFRPEEQTFAIALATLVSLGLEAVQRRNAEERASLRSAALEAAADAVVITDANGRIVWVNAAFTALAGYTREEARGRTPGQLLQSGRHDTAFYQELWRTIRGGSVWRGEMVNRRKDGSTYEEEMSITPIRDEQGAITHFIAVKHDLTDRRQLEARYLQAQKLESVGRLAGGVAHDFNNLLTVINGTADLALASLRQEDPIRDEFVHIREAGGRAAALTAQLLAFSRKQPMKREVVALHDTVLGMEPMLRRLIGEDLELAVSWDGEPVHVLGDRHQLEQVIMNLSVNARDAMTSGGRLAIAVGVEGEAAMLRVRDTGSGMSSETLAHIFEPFYTTKESGRGTGLGLATVHGIVEQSGGTIAVASRPGSGTEFTIRFPRSAAPAASHAVEPQHVPRRVGTVLVVEDEAVVRMVACRVLERAGYRVLQAERGEDALRMLESNVAVDLVMTDVVMPGMGGGELADRIRQGWPATRVLFTSGYSADAMPGLTADSSRQFIAKPYTVDGLARKVSEVIAA